VEKARPEALHLLDKQTLLRGRLPALSDFIARMGKAPATGPLADALSAAADKHHALFWARPAAALKALKGQVPEEAFEAWWALMGKPFLQARTVQATLDLGAEIRLDLRSEHADEQGAHDAETLIRAALYVARQALPLLHREAGLDAAASGKFAATLRKAEAALRAASVAQKKTTLTASVRFKPDDADLAVLALELQKTAERSRHLNNLKQIGLAFHNYHDTYGGMPGPAIYDQAGKPLLSWRVAILPFIEEDRLYKEFKLNEPWDSPHNKKLLARMPKVYTPRPGTTKVAHGTFYRVFTGPNAPFNPLATRRGPISIGPRMANFIDGTSNTFLVVEAAEAVPWTKPEELAYDPKKQVPKLGAQFPRAFLALLADGSVKVIKTTIDEKTLHNLINPQDGNVIDWDKVPELGRSRPRRGSEKSAVTTPGVKTTSPDKKE
jgi:hypothetical protein